MANQIKDQYQERYPNHYIMLPKLSMLKIVKSMEVNKEVKFTQLVGKEDIYNYNMFFFTKI